MKTMSLKWVFCLLGSVMIFACSKNLKEAAEEEENNFSDEIQLVNGMLVFPSYDAINEVIDGKEFPYFGTFKSQKQMFEEVVAAESKQMDYLDGLNGEELEKAPKHTSLYEAALKEGLIKEVIYTDGSSSYDYNLVVPYYAALINENGFFAVKDTLYQITNEYVKYWVGADLNKISVLAKSVTSDEEKNIFVFDYKENTNVNIGNSLSRAISFPAPPVTVEKGVVQTIKPQYIDGTIPYEGRFVVTFRDKLAFELPKYKRDLYIQIVNQKKIKGTNSYGFQGSSFDVFFTVKTQIDGVVSEPTMLSVSGTGYNVYYTFYPSFNFLLGGKTPQVTDEPYGYILSAVIWVNATIPFSDTDEALARVGFTMKRTSIDVPAYLFEIDSEHSQWLDVLIN